MSNCGHKTTVYKAHFYGKPYDIIPYTIPDEDDENNINPINPITIIIPEKYKNEKLYIEKGEKFILSKVNVKYSADIENLICKMTVDPLFFVDRTIY